MMHLMSMGDNGLLLDGEGLVMHRLHGNGDWDGGGYRVARVRDLDGMLRKSVLDRAVGLLAKIVPGFPRVGGGRLSLRPSPRNVVIGVISGDSIEILLCMRAYLGRGTSTDETCNLCPVALEETQTFEHSVMFGGAPHLADFCGSVGFARPWGEGVGGGCGCGRWDCGRGGGCGRSRRSDGYVVDVLSGGLLGSGGGGDNGGRIDPVRGRVLEQRHGEQGG